MPFLTGAMINGTSIFIIAGNHEFYNTKMYTKWEVSKPDTYEKRLGYCRALCSQWPNVHFLEKNEVLS
jgi:hypothetical protein